MKPYSVTIYYSGSKSYCVDAREAGDAEQFALDMFADDNHMDAEVTDIDLSEDDPDE
jgi:hypothetical protein